MVRTATGFIALYLRLTGFKGWTSLWDTIYVAPGWEDCRWLIRHEQAHLAQMHRDGKLVFMLKYSYWLLRYGYKLHPYEIEARKAEFP